MTLFEHCLTFSCPRQQLVQVSLFLFPLQCPPTRPRDVRRGADMLGIAQGPIHFLTTGRAVMLNPLNSFGDIGK